VAYLLWPFVAAALNAFFVIAQLFRLGSQERKSRSWVQVLAEDMVASWRRQMLLDSYKSQADSGMYTWL
jgi:hypothetical protein